MAIQGTPLWTWNTGVTPAVVTGYPSGMGQQPGVTKTGLLPQDLQSFVGIPLQIYANPPQAVDPEVILQWIRWAEDDVEQDAGLLLCPTWVASPPARPSAAAINAGIIPVGPAPFQELGFDYDLGDAAYDFFYARARDEGWMEYSVRYRPLRNITPSDDDFTSIKQISYNYPLLNEYFKVPPSWMVIDGDFGLLRLVPSVNVQMLPLFAMQLAFMGFAESVPGAIWMQYTAGLTQNDYNSRFSFIPQLVLSRAAMTALAVMQAGINVGTLEFKMLMDGVQYQTKYDPNGPFAGLIRTYSAMKTELMIRAHNRVSGPVFSTI
jgi:hypothetical protein